VASAGPQSAVYLAQSRPGAVGDDDSLESSLSRPIASDQIAVHYAGRCTRKFDPDVLPPEDASLCKNPDLGSHDTER